jgi:hypothetical protein
MGSFLFFMFSWWSIGLRIVAIIHFIRRRPDTYWIYVILFLGPIGATVYLFAEALPDIGLARQSLKGFSRRKRIQNWSALFSTILRPETTKNSGCCI